MEDTVTVTTTTMEKLTKVAALASVALVSAVISGLFVMLCWNYFPFLEGLRHFSWWDGMVLYIMANSLFKASK